MGFITVQSLSKEFKRQKRKEGFIGAVQGLVKREYETKVAVDDISFEVEKGEVVGYIGPNGAGKSTTIKMLVGILVPTSGTVTVDGLVPYDNRIENARRMGVVFGQRTQLWWDIPVSETFVLMKHMYKIPEKQFDENVQLFSDILGIGEFKNVPVRQLSLGQRMRADLCAALLHNPGILYLDEPTIGLDVVVKEKIRTFIHEINSTRKTTVILTTHDMSDIEQLCSRVMVIDHGKIVYNGNLEQLKNTYGSDEILTAFVEENAPDLSGLRAIGVSSFEKEGNKLTVGYDKREIKSSAILQWLMERTHISDFSVLETSIEEVIRRMYREQQSGQTGGGVTQNAV